MKIKLGTELKLIISPKLVLAIEEILSNWLIELSDKDEIDIDRECMAMNQIIVSKIAKICLEEK
jgi:hypothetical protein